MAKLNIKDWRMMLLVGVTAGALGAAPLGAYALNAQSDDDTASQTQTTADTSGSTSDESQTSDTTDATTTDASTDTTTSDTTNTDTTTTVDQTSDPTGQPEQPGETETTDSPTVADLQTAITIASAEHPDVEVVSAKLKELDGNKVYKVVFADGWIAYVSADNGSVLLLQNNAGEKQSCHNHARAAWLHRHKTWKPFDSEYATYSRSWLAKKNWAAAKHNWQPQQQSTNAQQSSDQTTTSASTTTSAASTNGSNSDATAAATQTSVSGSSKHTGTNWRRH